MALSPSMRKCAVSICFLLIAALAAAYFLYPAAPSKAPRSLEDRLQAVLPEADPLLVQRMAQNWGFTALSAAERHGEDGLHVLEAFEDEAAYCLECKPDAFAALVRVVRLDPVRFRLATGPWNRAVLDWAQTGKLGRFLARLAALAPDRLAIAESCPASMPLLCTDKSQTAVAMIEKYGDRAWRLFMAINFADHPQDLNRVAATVAREGDLILRLHEDYGLPYALLLVEPSTETGSRQFPEITKHALRTLDDELTALALIIVNYDAIQEMLDSGKPLQEIEEAIDTFAALPPVLKDLALDHANTLRLLTESWHGEKLGAEVLRRCGPAAADLIYSRYASDNSLKRPALVAMARLGEPAYQVFYRYRDYGKFHAFLRRCEPDLMNPRDNPPAVVHAIHNIYREGQDKLDIYVNVANLKGQVLAEVRGPAPEDTIWEWIPGYIAYRTAAKWADGQHVTGGDLFWATVDAASTATMVHGAVATSIQRTGHRLSQEGAKLAVKRGLSQARKEIVEKALESAQKQIAESAQKLALESAKREGADLTRFGTKATEIATRRLEARTGGLMMKLADRRQEYLELVRKGDVNGKAQLVEEIGIEGAREYASTVGYEPLNRWPPRQSMGFDLPPYRDGERIIVIEAKGGSGPMKTYRGHEQGTVEYIEKVAEWVSRSPVTSPEEKKVADEVLKAARDGRLYVEVVRTEHVRGTPGLTRVERVTGPRGRIFPMPVDDPRTGLLRTPGMSRTWIEFARKIGGEFDISTRIKQAVGMAQRLGIGLWRMNTGPLAPREVVRKGQRTLVQPSAAPSSGQVDNFAIALMEREM
ncbi:MAG: hypothetical protein NZ700_04525 [Gemmataceae bacterium]|nr:hypothetical protein [Gemmataceae bacterium]MDW8266486.1 hypothetical protein [Gemmataceae bacterium]